MKHDLLVKQPCCSSSAFIYHGYEISESGFEYHFSMGEHEFRPRWSFPDLSRVAGAVPRADDPLLRELVFCLGMVELVSYWKAACPPIVEIRCGSLDSRQIKWWKKLYRNGLGEFFYVNNITPTDDFMTIVCTAELSDKPIVNRQSSIVNCKGCLIPVGGGKDSIVTLELLRESKDDNLCYIVGDVKRAHDCARVAGYCEPQIIGVSRSIDPMLLELNRRGYLNGHTPFSAVVAFSSLVFAYLSGKKYIVLSNESSANESNLSSARQGSLRGGEQSPPSLPGSDVNHQYSKSTEFERDFREYAARISPDLPEYFSLLRPWNELQITQVFTAFPQYFPVFQSCNVGTRTNTWCCKCAKCVYVYVMLAAFLDDEVLDGIFGENLLGNPALAGILEALVNPELDKPFECVGTREEIALALQLRGRGNVVLPPFFDETHFVPKEFLKKLQKFF
jgi:hypothetical protein